MADSDSYLFLEGLIQKRLLVIGPDDLINWLNNLERTGQISSEESQGLLTLAEQLNIYDLPAAEYPILFAISDFYLHPFMLLNLDYEY